MSWTCTNCGNVNVNFDTSCSDCGCPRPKAPNQGGNATANTAQPLAGKWVIVCPDCGREIAVEGADAERERCPECGNDSIETVRASFKEDAKPVQTDEPPAPRSRLFIQAIEAVQEISDKSIYHQRGRTPSPISDRVEIFPPEMVFGRNFLPELGDYYRYISEQHCKFRCDETGSWYVSDANSKNGTRVNGIRLRGTAEMQLTKDSEIQMANRLFLVFIE